jgi:hypothetical protein
MEIDSFEHVPMTARRFTASAIVATLATVTIVLAIHGIGEDGLLAVIHATARTSAICFALAFARIRTRELLIALPVSHALHYGAILALAAATTPTHAHISAITAVGGAVIYGLMIVAAVRPIPAVLYLLWIIFVVAFIGRDMANPVYPALMLLLLAAPVARFAWAPPRAVEH